MPAGERFFRLADKPDGRGLSCDENGVHLGGVPLLRRTETGFEPRPAYEVEALIEGLWRRRRRRAPVLRSALRS